MDRYHYIQNGDGQEELYDCLLDPHEKSDISQYRQYQLILSKLRSETEAAT